MSCCGALHGVLIGILPSHSHQGCGTSSLKRIVACVRQQLQCVTPRELFICLSGAMQVQASCQRFPLPKISLPLPHPPPPPHFGLTFQTLHLRPCRDGPRESFLLARVVAKCDYLDYVAITSYMLVPWLLLCLRIVLMARYIYIYSYIHTCTCTCTCTGTSTCTRTHTYK